MARIDGTSGNDQGTNQLVGTSDPDEIYGLGGNDELEGLGGADRLDGGDGTGDRAVYRTSGAAVQVNLAAGTATGGDAEGDTFFSIEGLEGSAFGDTLTGDAGVNSFSGEDGDDVIEGGAGADLIDGGAFADSDTVTYFGSSAGVTVNLSTQSGSGGDAEGDEIYNTENITGSAHADSLTGDSGVNILTGGAGADTLNGLGGNDMLRGGSGDDTAVFSVTRASATITQSGSQIIVISADGTDTLEDVEFLQFNDQTVSVASLFGIQVTTFADTVDANDGVTSLREAVTQANAAGTQATIELAAGIYVLTADNGLDITGNVAIRGAGVNQTSIATIGTRESALHVHSGAMFELEDINLYGGSRSTEDPSVYGSFGGGLLLNNGGNVTINNASFESNTLDPTIFTTDSSNVSVIFAGTLAGKLNLMSFNNNGFGWNSSHGGAVFNTGGGVMEIVGSSFTGNVAAFGGALAANSGYVSVDSSVFDGNKTYTFEQDPVGKKDDLTQPPNISGEGAAIHSTGSARIDVFSNKAGNGTPTTIMNHGVLGDGVDPTISLIDGPIYLDPEIVVAGVGNSTVILDGVTRTTPYGGPAATAALAPMQEALAAAAAPGDNALLTLASSLNLSLDNPDLALVANAIASQSDTQLVVQLAGHRLVLTGNGLGFTGDPLNLTIAQLIAAASGTISGITITNADGSQTVGTVTGLSSSFASVVTNLTTPPADGSPVVLSEAFGVQVTQNGSAGNDVLVSSAAADAINGNGGLDITTYGIARAAATITQNGTTLTVVGEGTDALIDIERLQFTDGTLAFDLTGAAGQTFRLYRAAFDREPDLAGLAHNVNIMDGGLSIFDMANAFIGSAEFRQTYGEGIDNTTFLTLLYQNVLDRAPDQVGLDGWLGQLGSGETDLQHVLFGFSESAENKAATAALTDDGIWLG